MNENQSTKNGLSQEGQPQQGVSEAAERMKKDFLAMGGKIGVLSVAEALLRAPGSLLYEVRHGRGHALLRALLVTALICFLAYGLSVGMFSLGTQLWAAPLKITVGAILCALICFPSLVIFSYLGRSTSTIPELFGVLVAAVTLAALLLLGFGPVSWVFSQSTESAAFMGALHLVFWLIGLYYGLRFLSAASIHLGGGRNLSLRVWAVVFLVVSLQMTTTLRPLVGTSVDLLQDEKKFFLSHWIETIEHP